MGRPEGTELLLLLRIELILDPNEQGEVHLLHLLLDGRHLAQLGEHRRLVHVVGGQELAECLGFRVEPPLKVDQLLLRLVHRLLEGVHLGRPEPDLLLVLHHELRRKDLLQERGRAGRWTRFHHARATHPIGRSRPCGCEPTHEDHDQRATGHVGHARSLPNDCRCEYGASAAFTLGHPRTESEQPIEGTVAYTSSAYGSRSTSVGLVYSPTTTGTFAAWRAGSCSRTSQSVTAAAAA